MKKVKVMEKSAAPDFMAAIKCAAVPVSASVKKGSAPVVRLPENLEQGLKNFLEAKELKAKAEAEMKSQEQPLLAFMRGIQDEDGVSGKFAGSYDIIYGKDEKVKYVSADKFSDVKDEAIVAELKSLVGDEKKVVREQFEIKVREEVMSNPALQKELMERLGDVFNKFLEVEKKIVAVDGLNEKIYGIAGNDKGKVMKIRELVPQAKPFIR